MGRTDCAILKYIVMACGCHVGVSDMTPEFHEVNEWWGVGTNDGVLTMVAKIQTFIDCCLVAMSLSVTWQLESMLKKSVVGGDLAHLGLSSALSVHGCLPSFVSHGGWC